MAPLGPPWPPLAPLGVPKAFQGVPEASQGVPKASQGVPKASPGVPKVSLGVPKGCPQAFPQGPQDFLEILKKPRKNNGFWMIVNSMLASSWPQVGPRWLMLARAGRSNPQVGPSCAKLVQVGPKWIPSWPQVGPMLAHVGPSWPQVGPKLAPSWPQVGTCWLKLVQVGVSIGLPLFPLPRCPRRLCL